MKPDHDIFRHFAGSLTKSSRPSLYLDLHELSDQWVVKLVTWEEDKLKNKMYQRPEESFFLESVK
jgi:hypothetical protein